MIIHCPRGTHITIFDLILMHYYSHILLFNFDIILFLFNFLGWHTVANEYFPKRQKFSSELARAGMYRNYSLNTCSDQTLY